MGVGKVPSNIRHDVDLSPTVRVQVFVQGHQQVMVYDAIQWRGNLTSGLDLPTNSSYSSATFPSDVLGVTPQV